MNIQKLTLYILYALVALMVIFSFQATKNQGQQGFDSCVQEKCENKGEATCSKYREINNCCLGAGGNMAVVDNQQMCVF
jgi:hypothetical protein